MMHLSNDRVALSRLHQSEPHSISELEFIAKDIEKFDQTSSKVVHQFINLLPPMF